VPIPDPDKERAKQRIILKGDPPSPLAPPSGCVFRTRCPKATDICSQAVPALEGAGAGHDVACHHWRD
ncbi:MAG: oligopeptide ABC transporter ATP-binding protein OppF, partial [Rhodospirillaceae bacterium]